MTENSDALTIARETLAAIDNRKEMTPFSTRFTGFDLATAYAAASHLRQLREKRGEILGGRKVGFTNRAIWEQAGVDRPMWGDVYKGKMHRIDPNGGTFAIEGLLTPLLEPELMVTLSSAPSASMDEAALAGCIESYSIGFEIVQLLFGAAKIKQADTVGAGSMFAALLIGPEQKVDKQNLASLIKDFAAFKITLLRDGEKMDEGTGANVLGNPLASLKFLAGELSANPDYPPLRAGDIVSTGIITPRAQPIVRGETWSTKVDGIKLQDISVTFA